MKFEALKGLDDVETSKVNGKIKGFMKDFSPGDACLFDLANFVREALEEFAPSVVSLWLRVCRERMRCEHGFLDWCCGLYTQESAYHAVVRHRQQQEAQANEQKTAKLEVRSLAQPWFLILRWPPTPLAPQDMAQEHDAYVSEVRARIREEIERKKRLRELRRFREAGKVPTNPCRSVQRITYKPNNADRPSQIAVPQGMKPKPMPEIVMKKK